MTLPEPTNKERLNGAMSEMEKFLEENPHMVEKQKKIQEILAKTPEKDRLDVLFLMLGTKLAELNTEVNKLKEV